MHQLGPPGPLVVSYRSPGASRLLFKGPRASWLLWAQGLPGCQLGAPWSLVRGPGAPGSQLGAPGTPGCCWVPGGPWLSVRGPEASWSSFRGPGVACLLFRDPKALSLSLILLLIIVMCVITEKKMQLNIASLFCLNFFIIGGILIGGGRPPELPPWLRL